MVKGIIFDIEEFAVHDGPGIRKTVFLKGCPLKCMWCHNPEGISFTPELMVSRHSCVHCGRCGRVCTHPEGCVNCGECITACPLRLRKLCGTQYSSEDLAGLLLRDVDFLKRNGGGITFSGGEPLAQPQFLLELLERLGGVHKAIETSGYCDPEVFRAVIERLDYVIMDIKLVNSAKHKLYTGVENERIIGNLEFLKACKKAFVIRIPLIPGINDTDENLTATALLLKDAPGLIGVELLPYHKTAGSKYGMLNRVYAPAFDINREVNLHTACFTDRGIPCTAL
jgi:pyruvate formate lyase activating enzyme